MPFSVGQRVVWRYHQNFLSGRIISVDAMVVYDGPRRVRVQILLPNGSTAYRWAHPRNLRLKRSDEPEYPFPFAPKA